MSMIGNFVAISKEQLDAVRAAPDAITEILYPEDGSRAPDGQLDIDKAWHGIHFLLTGSAEEGEAPWSLAILGGTPIGPDVGYGPARFLLPEEVFVVATALKSLPTRELARRFDAKAMEDAEIYPNIWDEGQEALDYLLGYYADLVKYYDEAAVKNQAMLLYLN